MCKLCDQTNVIISSAFPTRNGLTVSAFIRFDRDDNRAEFDFEIKINETSYFSKESLIVEYCPFCGKQLKENSEGSSFTEVIDDRFIVRLRINSSSDIELKIEDRSDNTTYTLQKNFNYNSSSGRLLVSLK